MKKTKLVIAFVILVILCVSAVWAECNLPMRFGLMFSIVSASALLAVLVALLRAPEGYENENGFYIGARHSADKRVLDRSSQCLVLAADA